MKPAWSINITCLTGNINSVAQNQMLSAIESRAIQEISEALFVEWESELNEYTNRALRITVSNQLKSARQN